MKGTVKWYDTKKGYGFINGDDGNCVFAHRSDLSYFEVYLTKGDSTEYNIETVCGWLEVFETKNRVVIAYQGERFNFGRCDLDG